jgi:7-cyano-7-deazaguanine tRNA-ribosyltransferase
MDFYISWSHSDAIFSDYFNDCSMLISAIPSNKNFTKKFNTLPSKLIFDCGALFYARNPGKFKLENVLDIQLSMVETVPSSIPITLVHLDEPLLHKNTLSEKYSSVERTIFNAYEYINLIQQKNYPNNVSLMGVIQGYDISSTLYCIHELRKLGYKKFGLGSMLSRGVNEQIGYINEVSKEVGPENLHVFGVTGVKQIKEMSKLKIASFDSSRPTMVAAYHQVFYSNPFRTLLISESKITKTQERIFKPLNCDCPVCKIQPKDILNLSHRKYTKIRSVHNYYHLVKTIKEIQMKEGVY